MTLHFPAYTTVVNQAEQETPVTPHHTAQNASKHNLYRKYLKRTLDAVCVLLAGPVVLPLIILLAMLIALDGHNPFYSQTRIGRNGHKFRMWKLRTMVHNADTLLEVCLAADPNARREWETTQKLKMDPRITFMGKFLRKTSFDELPQLFNVLTGTMSLVGPRPMLIGQQRYYTGTAYYLLRPGITGMWQVSDRNNCEFQMRAYYDALYEEKLSLKTDVKILFQTVNVVLRATGH